MYGTSIQNLSLSHSSELICHSFRKWVEPLVILAMKVMTPLIHFASKPTSFSLRHNNLYTDQANHRGAEELVKNQGSKSEVDLKRRQPFGTFWYPLVN